MLIVAPVCGNSQQTFLNEIFLCRIIKRCNISGVTFDITFGHLKNKEDNIFWGGRWNQ